MRSPTQVVVFIASCASCHSAPTGLGRFYAPTMAEELAVRSAVELHDRRRKGDTHAAPGARVWLAGVVLAREVRTDGTTYLTLSVRELEPASECKGRGEGSCLPVVGSVELERAHVTLSAACRADAGDGPIATLSLVRVVGRLLTERDPDDGAQVVRGLVVRHFRHGSYSTTGGSAGDGW